MATTIQPRFDHSVTETPERLDIALQVGGRKRYALGQIFGGLVAALAFIVFFLGMVVGEPGLSTWSVWLAILAAGLFWFSKSKKTVKIGIDKDTIEVGDKRYLISHVSTIGYDSVANEARLLQVGGLAGTMAQAGAVANAQMGHYVYIVYGSDRIPIISGLTPNNVHQTYETITRFLAKFGHTFGNQITQ